MELKKRSRGMQQVAAREKIKSFLIKSAIYTGLAVNTVIAAYIIVTGVMAAMIAYQLVKISLYLLFK